MVKLMLILSLITIQNSFAKSIHCSYKNYTEHVSFKVEDDSKSISKTKKDKKYTYDFFIRDINKFDEVEDYVVVTDKKGHNVTYVLNCR